MDSVEVWFILYLMVSNRCGAPNRLNCQVPMPASSFILQSTEMNGQVVGTIQHSNIQLKMSPWSGSLCVIIWVGSSSGEATHQARPTPRGRMSIQFNSNGMEYWNTTKNKPSCDVILFGLSRENMNLSFSLQKHVVAAGVPLALGAVKLGTKISMCFMVGSSGWVLSHNTKRVTTLYNCGPSRELRLDFSNGIALYAWKEIPYDKNSGV